eukprot:508790_1
MEQPQNFFNLDALQELGSFDELDLQRMTSNPLLRCISNLSTASQDGGATFVPYGRGQQEYLTNTNDTNTSNYNAINFDQINKLLKQHQKAEGEQKTPEQKPQKPQLQPGAQPFTPYQSPVITQSFTPIIQPQLIIRPQTYLIPIQPQPQRQPQRQPQPVMSHQQQQPKAVRINRKKTNKRHAVARLEIKEIIKQNISLEILLSHNMICKLLKDQNGSRYIQDKLTKNKDSKLIDIVLKHIIFTAKQILDLSEDIFGNYVIQIFFEISNETQIQLLIDELLINNCQRLTHSVYGCRVIQKAFDRISKSECIRLVNELSHSNNEEINKYIIGPNSNHVIQKILTLDIDSKHFDWINECIMNNISFYSSHIFGCRIVQNLIKLRGNNSLLISIVTNDKLLLILCKSEYGNYVVQDIINYNGNDKRIISMVKDSIFKNILNLSKNKFGSNVVEKCLMISKAKDIDQLLNKLLVKNRHKNMKNMLLVEMIQDKFANYVIQKLLNIANHKQQSRIIYFVQKHINNLKGLKYGKHIMDKIKKITKSEYYEYRY